MSYGSNRFPPSITPVVGFILATNILVFLIQMRDSAPVLIRFALWPLGTPEGHPASFQVWQLVSYGWLHGSQAHILVNMFAVWMFGKTIEAVWGSRRFAIYYLVCIVGAGLIQLVVATRMAGMGQIVPTVGASGGVFGLLLAFAVLFPNEKILLLIPPVPIKAKYFVIGYGALELYMGITQTQSGVAHFAHLGGMVFGLLLILLWRKQRRRVPNFTDI